MAGGLDLVIRYVSRLTGTQAARQTADGALTERFIQHHDEAAFAELLHRHGPMVWTVCRQILREPQDAEDAFQATFLVLVRKARSIRRRSSTARSSTTRLAHYSSSMTMLQGPASLARFGRPGRAATAALR